jgi:predicted nucleic acid-binding protein
MPRPSVLLDSSALFAGVVSATGASRALLVLSETSLIALTISEQVVAETERALARKAPRALPGYREALRRSGLAVVRDPTPSDVAAHAGIVRHQPDAPIVVAAMQARVDYLVTLNRRHFIDDPDVAARSGVLIGTPGDALVGVRGSVALPL